MSFTGVDSALHALAGRSSIVDALSEAAAQAALYVALGLVVILLWPRRQVLRAALAAAVGALVALGVGAVVGALWDRPRPFVDGHYAPLIAHAADASFPSDHLIALGALTAAAWLVWRAAGAVLALVAAALAVGRAIVGIHYVTDLVGGFLMGVGATVLCWMVLGTLRARLEGIEHRADRLPFRGTPRGPQPTDAEARASIH